MARRVEETVMEGWFRDPPPLIAAMASEPTLGVTRALVLQWTKFSRLFPRWVGAIVSNCPESAVVAYEVENLMSEVVRDPAGDDNHYELLIRLGESVGLTRAEIEAHPVLTEASETFEWLWEQARHPDWLVGFTAVNGLEILGDRNLPLKYGSTAGTGLGPEPYARTLRLGGDALEFFEVSDQADAGHGHETVDIIARYTPSGREDDILMVLTAGMARLRRMMNSVWDLAMEIDAGLETKARSDDER
ncbi:MAG TPA: iron-containing redox enzyme family protein [Acidimicrobiales bacterium]|jgi:pyrroloquinoline-quinone synthase|nr:iron-containing redox enzyme family protein [Acidimicrobiales bacterium]